MNFENLLKNRKIEKIEKENKIDFKKVEEDIKSSKDIFTTKHFEWTISIAYNAVLRASRNLMFSLGYRAIGKEHHKNVFEFLKSCALDKSLITYFNRIRIKRNEFIYRDAENFSKSEAQEVIEMAEKFVQEIRTFVQEIRTGNKK